MEDVDEIIFQRLRILGWETEESKLSSLSSDELASGLIHCLHSIEPSTRSDIPSHSLPPQMSSRVRVASRMAELITALGYNRDPLGYQSILYSNPSQLRNIFLFLLERLPKDADVGVKDERSELVSGLPGIIREAKSRLKGELKEPHLPWYAPRLISQRRLEPWDWLGSESAWVNHLDVVHSLLASGTVSQRREKLELLEKLQGAPRRPQGAGGRAKPAIAPKPRVKESSEGSHPQPAGVEEDKGRQEMEAERDLLLSQVQEAEDQTASLKAQIIRWVNVTSEKKSEEEQRADARIHRWVGVLEGPEEAMVELKKLGTEREERMMEVERKWAMASEPLRAQVSDIRARLTMEGSGASALLEVKEERAELTAEAEEKEEHLRQLEKELARHGSKGDTARLPREAYTKRIMEVLGTVQKQRGEIIQVLGERRKLEAELNRLTAKVERTVQAADEELFLPAKTDTDMRRLFKLVHAVHDACEAAGATLEETGAAAREAGDFQESLEAEEAKDTDSNLERIVTDLGLLQEENIQLATAIAALRDS